MEQIMNNKQSHTHADGNTYVPQLLGEMELESGYTALDKAAKLKQIIADFRMI